MDGGAALLIARAFPDFTASELRTVCRALDVLKITTTFASPEQGATAEAKLIVSFDNKSENGRHEDTSSLYAEFDLESRRWRLERLFSPYPATVLDSPLGASRHEPYHDAPELQANSSHNEYNSHDGLPVHDTLSIETRNSNSHDDLRIQQGHVDPSQREDQQENGHDDDDNWTLQIPRTPHNQFVLDTQWDKTALGPMDRWPLVLRLMTLKMLRDPRPATLYWGPQRVAIYNEQFSIIAASRHPAMMGATAEQAMPATWPFLKLMMQEVQDSGKAFSMAEFEMQVHKEDGFLEEAWYDGVFSPITDTSGNFMGIYNSGDEISTIIAAIPDFSQVTPWQHIIQSCQDFARDVPMLLVYSADVETNMAKRDHCILRFEGSLGLSSEHEGAIPHSFDLSESNHLLAQAFNSSKALNSCILLDMPGEKMPAFLENILWCGHAEPSTHIAVMPIFTNGLIAGFMVMGLNPRRPYDDELKQLVNDVWRTATFVVSSSINAEQAFERERTLTRELTQRERFIRKIAEVATVGIYSLSDAGTLTYANARYHDVVQTPTGSRNGQLVGFEHFILLEDLAKITEAHEKCKFEQINITTNVRLKHTWAPPGSVTEQHRWVMNSIVPDVVDGRVQGIIGFMADICRTMWALQLQKDSTKAALDSKQHLERFIDMTSHEMRNPLGATLQCADDISRSIDHGIATFADVNDIHDFLESIRENAKTISFCSAHQKSIADDILVASKLSSSLMSLCPAVCQPEVVVKEVMQMFKTEAFHESIDMELIIDPSYNVAWALCDAPRLRQILINLLTNAVKFTKGRSRRRINVVMGASNVAPPSNMADLIWHPQDSPPPPGISDDSQVFLTFEVRDTGKGLNQEETSRLFNRFSQANSTTSNTYGGSGLGLFISMELTELQGGRIGLSSKEGEGSTSGFYIKVQKTSPNEQEAQNRRKLSETPRMPIPNTMTKQHLDILLVEDNLVNQRVLKKQLHQKGHCVYIANHGLEALEFLQTTRFWRDNDGFETHVDVILMDWEISCLNGIDCTKKIRELEQQGMITDHLPIIVTSANSRVEQQEEAFAAGTDKFLSKPFLVTQLLETIRSFGT